MPPALSNAASIMARTSAVSRFGVPFGLPWPDVLLLGIRKSPHFALIVSRLFRHQDAPMQGARHLAAWAGMTPKERSSGGKRRLGGINRAGHERLRVLLVSATCRLSIAQNRSPEVIELTH
jgi:hypothetical protein